MDVISMCFDIISSEEYSYEKLTISEDISRVDVKIQAKKISPPKEEPFINNIKNLLSRLITDTLCIDIYKDESCILSLYFNKSLDKEDMLNFFDDLIYSETYDKSSKIYINITIDKTLDNTGRNIYFINEFVKYLNNLSINELVTNFIALKNKTNYILFFVDDTDNYCYSNQIFFGKRENLLSSVNLSDKSNPYETHHSCHLVGISDVLQPDIFKLIKLSSNSLLNNLFSKLCTIFSLIYICNESLLNSNNCISFNISGYKLIKLTIDTYQDIRLCSIYDIYKWVYTETNITDRLELARNVISLDYNTSLVDINNDTLASIQSNYNIYLKENVDRYLELKNKINDILLDLSFKSKDISSKISSNLKAALIANLSFIFSILISNIINHSEPVVLNKSFSIIYIAINIFSLLYLFVSLIICLLDILEYKKIFQRVKISYSKIIVEHDLNEIFNKTILKDDIKTIILKVGIYAIFWVITILLSFIVLYFLSPWFKETLVSIFYMT